MSPTLWRTNLYEPGNCKTIKNKKIDLIRGEANLYRVLTALKLGSWGISKWYIFWGLCFFEILGETIILGGLYPLGGLGTFWPISYKQISFYFIVFIIHKDLIKILYFSKTFLKELSRSLDC